MDPMDITSNTEPEDGPTGRPADGPDQPDSGDPSGPPEPQQPPIGAQLGDRLRSLRRSRDRRVVAGVCGGVARTLGVDPLLLRVVLAALVLFGGAGIALYAAGWLLLPEDDGTPSLAQRAVGRGSPTSTRTVVVGVVLAVVAFGGVLGALRRWDGGLLLALAVVGLVLWLLRSPSGGVRPVAPAAAPAPPQGWAPPPGAGPATSTVVLTKPAPPAAPAAPRPPRERSGLFGLTLSVLLIALGVLAATDVAGAALRPGSYVALALTVVGGGLLVGAWRGRARGLVPIGIVLSLLTMGSAAASQVSGSHLRWSGHSTDQTVTITSTGQLPRSDDFSTGQVTYDLSRLDLAGASATLTSRMGAGEIVVVVPRTTDVTVDAHAGVGQVDVLGQSAGGPGTTVRRTDDGPDGPGGGALTLDLSAGVGHVEVRRATS
jgi:phage shock protein PspC (stress-responsive transcriptional regulator)